MSECELCGKVLKSRISARIGGVVLEVCPECAKSGEIIEQPKHYSPKPVLQSKPEAEEVLVPDFAQLIRQARGKAGLKQEVLAQKLNEKLSLISAAESGKRLDLKLAKKLEKFLKIELIETV